jgi:hypothetical protein
MTTTVKDNPTEHRFELIADGKLAGVIIYEASGNTLRLVHTEVFPENEGKGYGSTLAKQTLDAIRAQGKRIVPLCSFIETYLKRHPEYQELIEH